MILWINGPFGIGKTTVGRAVVQRVPAAHLVDVEHIGALIRLVAPPSLLPGDYQHDPLWPRLCVEILEDLDGRAPGPLVVPMTVWERRNQDRIVGELRLRGVDVRHVTLMAPFEVLRTRIVAGAAEDPAATGWREAMAERCLAALSDSAFARHVDCSSSVVDVVDAVLEVADIGCVPS